VCEEADGMIQIDDTLTPSDLLEGIESLWDASARKIIAIDDAFPRGPPPPW
jgi:hypothetical protein